MYNSIALEIQTEAYRSGHNELDSKSSVPHGTVGSNPTASAITDTVIDTIVSVTVSAFLYPKPLKMRRFLDFAAFCSREIPR